MGIIRIPVAEANICAFNKPGVAYFHAAVVIMLRGIFHGIGGGKDFVKNLLILSRPFGSLLLVGAWQNQMQTDMGINIPQLTAIPLEMEMKGAE